MKESLHLLLIWLGVVSVLTFALFGWDKLMAKLHRRRIPEAALLACALAGFPALVPLALLAHAALLAWSAAGP